MFVQVITRNLDKIIDINHYPVKETKVSNLSERPLGIGVQGLADVFFKMRVAYDSPEAAKLNLEIFETIYYAALSASCDLAKELGTYKTYKGSPFSEGKFQFNLWAECGTELTDKISGRWDWNDLRDRIEVNGLRNSLLTALMPTASTAQIMGSAAEAFEPITSNVYSRRTLAGEFPIINKYLTRDLLKMGLWSEKMKNKLMKHRGSIQNIREIPQDLKDIYKTCWEVRQKVLIDMSADRGLFVDQSQSLNLFFEKPDFNLLHKAHFYGWKRGLKTGSYYIRSKPATASVSFTLKDPDAEDQFENSDEDLDEISETDYNSDLDDDTEESENQSESEDIDVDVSNLPSMGNDDCDMCGA